ncbi:GNAT family N-acetyltransferase [Micrococcus luteus]|uniref:GNAT family N-acetyltransferase n=1 Tax=Micrococcus luteus TaxID=1270 RepID=UPI001E3B5BA8|nr:GNAT family protein [Micrococcus luteus]MCD0178947.1 GNAT family N-acetyltransferase [Micrococcus luteus]MCV7481840.1 GNAT family N-acetyltransferase [Micrococcus luteus]MCV7551400.1 GNAT family N-acetyltransferase [Micrococcus luteus]MCV7563709.1 GNAT family N-acetyltransferase [Micrococcus luteus]MCV7570183.1 GNAT family N-acetyltransferase [Micrococcus luteus]
MSVTFTRIDPAGADRTELISFMTGSRWPMHMRPQLTFTDVEEAIAAGAYSDEDNRSFWIDHAKHGRVGFVRLEDLTDPTPLFDLRLTEAHRGKGLAAPILTALTAHVFSTLPEVDRFEGQTRDDNFPMRRTFQRAGWVKEAHYRRGWPVDGAEPRASVAYAILRQDWENGTTTPVPWDDLPA